MHCLWWISANEKVQTAHYPISSSSAAKKKRTNFSRDSYCGKQLPAQGNDLLVSWWEPSDTLPYHRGLKLLMIPTSYKRVGFFSYLFKKKKLKLSLLVLSSHLIWFSKGENFYILWININLSSKESGFRASTTKLFFLLTSAGYCQLLKNVFSHFRSLQNKKSFKAA